MINRWLYSVLFVLVVVLAACGQQPTVQTPAVQGNGTVSKQSGTTTVISDQASCEAVGGGWYSGPECRFYFSSTHYNLVVAVGDVWEIKANVWFAGSLVNNGTFKITKGQLGTGDGITNNGVMTAECAGSIDPFFGKFTGNPIQESCPPDTSITANPTNPSGSSASFSFSGSDNITADDKLTFECRLDSASFATCTSPQSYSNLTAEDHTFQVRAKDAAGNIDQSPASYTWTVDTTAPTVTINQAAVGQSDPTSSNPVKFDVVFSESVTGFTKDSVTLGGTADRSAATVAVSGSGSTYTVTVDKLAGNGTITASISANAAKDAAGNGNTASTSTDNSVTVNFDTTPPTTTITANPSSPNGTNSWYMTAVTLKVSASDASGVAETRCALDPATAPTKFDDLPASCSYTGNGASVSSNGSHTLYAASKDTLGNKESIQSLAFKIDATAPDSSITANPTNPSNSSSASFGFSGSDTGGSGVASVECKLDSAAFTACTSNTSQSYSGLSNGPHTFQVRAKDAAGNVDPTPASYTWSIDTAPPTCSASVNTVSLWSPNHKLTPVTVTFSGSDGTSGSGLASIQLTKVESSEADSGLGTDDVPDDIQGWPSSTSNLMSATSVSGYLRSERYSTKGRTYKFTFQVTDSAGNTNSCTTSVSVPKSQGK